MKTGESADGIWHGGKPLVLQTEMFQFGEGKDLPWDAAIVSCFRLCSIEEYSDNNNNCKTVLIVTCKHNLHSCYFSLFLA